MSKRVIYLQVGDGNTPLENQTWADEQVEETDVKYIRADHVDALTAENERLRSEAEMTALERDEFKLLHQERCTEVEALKVHLAELWGQACVDCGPEQYAELIQLVGEDLRRAASLRNANLSLEYENKTRTSTIADLQRQLAAARDAIEKAPHGMNCAKVWAIERGAVCDCWKSTALAQIDAGGGK